MCCLGLKAKVVQLDAESQAAQTLDVPAGPAPITVDLEHESPKRSRLELKDLECVRFLGASIIY